MKTNKKITFNQLKRLVNEDRDSEMFDRDFADTASFKFGDKVRVKSNCPERRFIGVEAINHAKMEISSKRAVYELRDEK